MKEKKSELLFSDDGIWSVADHRPDGRLLLSKATGSLSREYSELDPRTKSLKSLLGQGEKEEYDAAYGSAPGELIVVTPKFGEYRRLYRHRGESFEPITPEIKWDISAFSIDQQRKKILYTVNENGYTRLYARNAKTGDKIELPKIPDADHVYAGGFTNNGRFVTIGVETDQGGDTWYSVVQQAWQDLVASGAIAPNMRQPRFVGARAGSVGPKAERGSRMLTAYERDTIRHVRGTHTVLERALNRFLIAKPFDLCDAAFWSWDDLANGGSAGV
jgi:hypothetical protein